MAVTEFNFTTGPASLPDVGTLAYNGCTFSPLYSTSVNGAAIKDDAGRTVKYMEYTITASGYVTLPDNAASTTNVMATMRKLLSAQGGSLTYLGRGCDIVVTPSGVVVNAGGFVPVSTDVAWGPVPELLEFQPLGGGLSAKVQWQVKTRIPEIAAPSARGYKGGGITVPLLQFNYDTNVSYDEAGYSTLSINGVMEIPMTRGPLQSTRTLVVTADTYRTVLDQRIFSGINLEFFRVLRRDYALSRDKRTLEFRITIEELPYMDMPMGCTVARGTYSVRPKTSGMGLMNWLCTLRATYTISGNNPRRLAWWSFLGLLRHRMAQSAFAPVLGGAQNPPIGQRPIDLFLKLAVPSLAGPVAYFDSLFVSESKEIAKSKKAWLIDFSFDEGLYLDSKTTSFSATWRLTCPFSHILLASGLWTKLPEKDPQGNRYWAASVKGISGSSSWLTNTFNPNVDAIVDFGGG